MRFTRREFVACAAGLIPFAGFSRRIDDSPFTVLRGNVGTFVGRGGTIGWLVSDDAFVVVDTQFPETAEQCLEGLRQRTDRPLDLVINTHHHGDHTAGNGVFKPHASHIVAHKNVPELQRKAAEERGTLDDQVYADVTFEDTWSQDLGRETIRMQYYGPAHTSGDAIVHFENANVVHMGDLVFNRTPPYIDRPAGASIQSWINVLERVQGDFSDETLFIFGHSHPDYKITGIRSDLGVMRNFLDGLLEYVQKGVQEGKSVEALTRISFIPGFPEHSHEDRQSVLVNAVRIAYEELSESGDKSVQTE